MSEMHLPGTGASPGNLILLPRLTRCNKRSKDMDHATRVHVQSSRRVRIQNQRWVIQTRNVTAKGSRQKKRIFYGQADRKRLPLPPLRSAFCEFFCVCFFILDYDSMCSEMDFTPEKSFSSNYKNSQLLLTDAAALPQNGQIAV